jgi:hypothetical protein
MAKHTGKRNLSQFPFCKDALESSSSPDDWQNLKDNFVGSI